MHLEKLGIPGRKACVILGAGATRGASCFDADWVDPPLDLDFFLQAERISHLDRSGNLKFLLESARDEFGNLDLSMESFFTQIESLDSFHRDLKIDRGRYTEKYTRILELFAPSLAAFFSILKGRNPDGEMECKYHGAIAQHLGSGDSVISFNYDCIMDAALRSEGGRRWDASSGYGVSMYDGFENWHDHDSGTKYAKSSILNLKVHGSLNWDRSVDRQISLRSNPYDTENRAQKEIVPPVWNKRISGDDFLPIIWKQARDALRNSGLLIVIGYSVPETDLLSQSLLRVAPAEGGQLDHLILINPSGRDRAKLKGLYAPLEK